MNRTAFAKNLRTLIIKTLSILLILSSVLLFSSCRRGPLPLAPTGETRVVTDCMGRKVKVPVGFNRVACLYASTAHMMAMLDSGDKIVSAADGVRRDVLMQIKYPEIENVSTPYREGAINIEELVELHPDIVLLKREVYLRDSEREKLDSVGVPYLVVDYFSLSELKTAITVMGELFEKQDKAQKYIDYMDETFAYIAEHLKDVPEDGQPVAYHSLNQATVTDVYGSLAGEVFT